MKLLTIIFVLLFSVSAQGTKHYVDTTGDNSNGLSWATAYKHPDSISNEKDVLTNYDTVYFSGVWHDVQIVCDTGVHYYGGNGSDNTITHGGGKFIGGGIVTGWDTPVGNVYPTDWNDTPGKANTGYTTDSIYCLIQIDTVNGDTLQLHLEYSSGAVATAGEFFHDVAEDSLWVYPHNMNSRGLDANVYKFIGSSKVPMLVCNSATLEADDVVIEALHIIVGRSSCIQTNSNNAPDNCTIRGCNLAWVNGKNANNTACIRGVSTGSDTSAFAHNLHIVSDTFNHVNQSNPGGEHSSGFETYSSNGGVVESCVVYFDVGIGFHFKGSFAGPDSVQLGNCVKRNVVYGDSSTTGYGITQSSSGSQDSAYGNIIIGVVQVGLYYRCRSYTAVGAGGPIYIFNNTFIGCRFGMVLAEQGAAESPSHIKDSLICKYNIFYDCDGYGGGANHLMRIAEADTNLPWIDIDSNIYYNTSAQSWQLQDASTTTYNTLAAWIDTVKSDSQSITADPGLDSVNASNPWLGCARTGAPAEMSQWFKDNCRKCPHINVPEY